jgi:hypothetical protein
MKILLLTFFSAIVASKSFSQVLYHDIVPDTTVNTWNVFFVSPWGASSSDGVLIWYHPTPEVVVQTNGDYEILFSGSFPAKLQPGDSISPSATWNTGSYDALNSGGTGNWQTSATDKYLGFRFKNPTNWHYGWIKMSVAAGATSFTVKEWAYNTQADKSIRAGQVATTGISAAGQGRVEICQGNNNIQFRNLEAGVKYTVNILDISGHKLAAEPVAPGGYISVSDFAPGTYVLQLFTDNFCCNFLISK